MIIAYIYLSNIEDRDKSEESEKEGKAKTATVTSGTVFTGSLEEDSPNSLLTV